MGKWLLARYPDELPQFFNIMRGDMRLVGPRPVPLAMYQGLVKRGYLAKSDIPAGLTGVKQLEKGTGKPLETLGLQYGVLEGSYANVYARCSFLKLLMTDLGVLFRTLPVVLKGNGLDYEPGITAFSGFTGREAEVKNSRLKESDPDREKG